MLKQYEKALQTLQQVIDNNSVYNVSNAFLLKGITYQKLGSFAPAEVSFKKAIELNPKLYPFYKSFGVFCFQNNRYEQALAQFQKSLKIQPGQAETYGWMGDTYTELQNIERSLEMYKTAKSLAAC